MLAMFKHIRKILLSKVCFSCDLLLYFVVFYTEKSWVPIESHLHIYHIMLLICFFVHFICSLN